MTSITNPEADAVLQNGPPIDDRAARLTAGADALAGQRRSIVGHPQFLLAASATLMTLGLTAVLLGWLGAARSTIVEEQVPYLISGGLLGVALATIGALMLFTHWLTVSIREARQHEGARRQDHEELIAELRSLAGALTRQEDSNGRTRGARPERPLRGAARRS